MKPTADRQSPPALDIDAMLAAVRNVVGDQPAPLHEPEFAGHEWDYVKDCLDTGWVSSVGSYVNRFEAMLTEIAGTRHAVATVNGTAALQVALLVAGVEPGDEVLVPTLTFIATANAVVYAGATPHFVDSAADAPGLDVETLDAHLADIAAVEDGVCRNRATGRIIRAIVPMHVFGTPVDMDPLAELARRWKLAVVEDAAEAIGSTYRGRPCGGLGDVGIFSFNGNKIVTTGGGGAILTDDDALAARAKHLTTTARVKHRWSFIHDEVGFNYRLPNLNAALGCAQLEQLDGFLERKRRLFEMYSMQFEGLSGATILGEPSDCRSNHWLVAVALDDPTLEERDSVIEALNDAGFGVRPVWTLMHRLPMFRERPRAVLANAEAWERRLINLPSSARLDR